jgi:hypothetical protein
MLPVAYFPEEQLLAVFVPLLLPILVPILSSLRIVLKRYRSPQAE